MLVGDFHCFFIETELKGKTLCHFKERFSMGRVCRIQIPTPSFLGEVRMETAQSNYEVKMEPYM